MGAAGRWLTLKDLSTMKARLDASGHLWYMCRGCGHKHVIAIEGRAQVAPGRPVWTWNGSTAAPTVTPSVLGRSINLGAMTEDEHAEYEELSRTHGADWLLANSPFRTCCHTFITDGRIQYLSDCTHQLAGQTIELPELSPVHMGPASAAE